MCNVGYSNAVEFEIAFSIESVSAYYSSYAGGRLITIYGFGFQTESSEAELTLAVGDLECEIEQILPDSIVFRSAPNRQRKTVRLTPSGPLDDEGMEASVLQVEVGTEVLWSWRISIPGSTPVVQLQRVQNAGDEETSDESYWSEEMRGSEGRFLKLFANVGVYHYSTGYVDSATMVIKGTIEVIPASDQVLPIRLSLNNEFEADHNGQSDSLR